MKPGHIPFLTVLVLGACGPEEDGSGDPDATSQGDGTTTDSGESDGGDGDGATTSSGGDTTSGGGATTSGTGPQEGDPGWGICWNVPSTPESTCEEHCGAGRCAVDACEGLTWMWWDLDGAYACGTQDFSSPVMTGHGCDDQMPGWDGSQNSFAVCCCLLPYPGG